MSMTPHNYRGSISPHRVDHIRRSIFHTGGSTFALQRIRYDLGRYILRDGAMCFWNTDGRRITVTCPGGYFKIHLSRDPDIHMPTTPYPGPNDAIASRPQERVARDRRKVIDGTYRGRTEITR